MYDGVVRPAKGCETRGTVRSFANKYYTKAAVEAPRAETTISKSSRSYGRTLIAPSRSLSPAVNRLRVVAGGTFEPA